MTRFQLNLTGALLAVCVLVTPPPRSLAAVTIVDEKPLLKLRSNQGIVPPQRSACLAPTADRLLYVRLKPGSNPDDPHAPASLVLRDLGSGEETVLEIGNTDYTDAF